MYRGSVLSGQAHAETYPPHTIFYAKYDPAIRQMVKITPSYLAEIEDWNVNPCEQCGFALLTDGPSSFIPKDSEILYFEQKCPFCGGVQKVSHKHYIPPVEETEPGSEEEIPIPWWKFWLRWFG